MELDDFDSYMRAKREELRVTPGTFWPDFFWTLAFVAVGSAAVVSLTIAAPTIRAFFIQ